MPPPKAISHGSNATGGGAFTALRAISAAKAEPETIASAVANKATFFMTIPVPPKLAVQLRHPQGQTNNRLRPNVLTWSHSGPQCRGREAKKASMCRLFRRSDPFIEGCPRVLYSHNNSKAVCARQLVWNRRTQAAAPLQSTPFANQPLRENTESSATKKAAALM